MRIVLSFVLTVSGVVGAASPAFASKSNATIKASAKSAVQGSTVTLTMTAKKFKTKRWSIQVKKDGAWTTFCDGKPKKGKLKCKGTLPLEGTNSFRAECFWCNNFKTVYSAKATIKGTPAIGSPKNPAAMGTYLALGDDTSKAGDLAVNSVNWNATATYCSNFTNEKVQYESASDPCAASTAKPEICEPTCDIYEVNFEAWKPKTAIPNPAFTGNVISVGLTYVQSKGGSDRVPSVKLRQSDGSIVDSMYSHPGSTNPVGFYETYEATIQSVAITRNAFFTVSKAVSSGNVVVSGYDFGQYPTRGLYEEAWLAAN
jgi:hypothetical protein